MTARCLTVLLALSAWMTFDVPTSVAEPQCPPAGCPHGPVNSPSYKDGYQTEHDYFATPQNRAYLASEMKNGYNATMACQVEVRGGSAPANVNDWLAGCIDALHDLGFKP